MDTGNRIVLILSTLGETMLKINIMEKSLIQKIINKYPFLKDQEEIINFALEMQKAFNTKGFYFYKANKRYIVGQPTR